MPVKNKPHFRVGILGGGQLAKMLALAGYPLGIHTLCYEPVADTCANIVTDVITADYDDETQLQKFASQVDLITFETENIPLQTAEFVKQFCPIYPSLKALSIGQDRLNEKNLFNSLQIKTPLFAAIHSLAELEAAINTISYPAVLKTRRLGYDGKGQMVLREAADLQKAWEKLGKQALIVEQFVKFDRELSMIAVRDHQQNTVFYPLIENQHRDGILRLSLAPYHDDALQQQAQKYVQKLLEALDYIGVLVIEFFQVGQQLLANEMAPRVHNSGHWTIEGAQTSQFENHLRAICNLPLGSTEGCGYSAMLNLIGTEPDAHDILQIPGTHLHTYEKKPVPGRKLGHVTLTAADEKSLKKHLEQLLKLS